MTPTDLKDATGLSLQALKNIRNGEIRDYQDRLTMPLTRVFGWSPDSIARILAGGEPVMVSPPPGEPDERRQDERRLLWVTAQAVAVLLDAAVADSEEDLGELLDELRTALRAAQ